MGVQFRFRYLGEYILVATVSLEEYEKLLEDRPRKFSQQEVAYRRADGLERCSRCMHFFVRLLDRFATCEIFRSSQTDRDGVSPVWVCNFFTKDGKKFPLLGKELEPSEESQEEETGDSEHEEETVEE